MQSITPVLVQNQRIYNGSLQEGFLSGGSITANYSDHYLNENSPSDVLNPSVGLHALCFVPAQSLARLRRGGKRPADHG